jgi:hypothetical protein
MIELFKNNYQKIIFPDVSRETSAQTAENVNKQSVVHTISTNTLMLDILIPMKVNHQNGNIARGYA